MFNLFKGKKAKENCSCCSSENTNATCCETGNEEIKILGGGCAKCNALEDNAKQAMKELGLELSVGHVKDFEKIATYGVMSTPALVVKEKVVSSGSVLDVESIKKILEKEEF